MGFSATIKLFKLLVVDVDKYHVMSHIQRKIPTEIGNGNWPMHTQIVTHRTKNVWTTL